MNSHKIALTGGPSAGKTTVAEVLTRTFADQVCIVPESAALLFKGGFPRESDVYSLKCQQTAIYHVQVELENIMQTKFPDRHLVCDRGTLDGHAYWPTHSAEFFSAIHSSLEKEIARYDWVIHLETTHAQAYQANQIRIESHEEALAINQRVLDAWKEHPQRIIIKNNSNFAHKIDACVSVVQGIFDHRDLLSLQKMASH